MSGEDVLDIIAKLWGGIDLSDSEKALVRQYHMVIHPNYHKLTVGGNDLRIYDHEKD